VRTGPKTICQQLAKIGHHNSPPLVVVCSLIQQLSCCRIPKGWTKNDGDICFHFVKFFVWDDPYLFKYCSDQVFRKCIPDHTVRSVLSFCHDQVCGGHFSGRKTAAKVLQYGFYWPTLFKDAFEYCKS